MKQKRTLRTSSTLVLTAAVLSCTDKPLTMEPAIEVSPQMATTAANLPPVADAGGSYTGTVNTSIRFNGSGSSDPDGPNSKLKYAWDFGDGSSPGSGKGPSHIYTAVGTYTVTLTVTDGSGDVSEPDTAQVTVSPPNQKPVANPGGPYTAIAGVPVQLDGRASEDPDDNTPLTYAWNFGDKKSGTGATPMHTYAKAGTYTVTLTVKDAKGLSSTPATTTVTVASSGATSMLIADGFSRRVADGWGTADVGGSWFVEGATNFRVDGSSGIVELHQTEPVNAVGRDLKSYGLNVAGAMSFSIDRAPDSTTAFHTVQVYARRDDRQSDGNNYYRYRVTVKGSGAMHIRMEKNVIGTRAWIPARNIDGTIIDDNIKLDIRFSPGTKYWIRWEAFGTRPATTVRMRVWQDGTTEPVAWHASAVVDEPALDVSGTTGVRFETPNGQMTWPVRLSVDDLQYFRRDP